jgi:hypothetical protein
LFGVSVSVGQGATGGVVGAGVDGGSTPGPDAALTIGTNPVVGHQPPSSGTGVTFNSRYFHPPPSVPILPG